MKKLFACILIFSSSFLYARADEVLDIPDEMTFQEAIDYMLENNFPIRQAQEDIRQREGLLITARASALPNLSLNYEYQIVDDALIENFGGPDGNNDDQSWSISLDVRQSIYSGFGDRASRLEQKNRRESAILDLQAVINEQIFRLRSQYYLLLLNKEKIEVQEAFLKLREEQLENVTKRFEAGTVSRFEKLQAQVGVANARPPLIKSKNDLRIAAEEFRAILGYSERRKETVDKLPSLQGRLAYEEKSFSLWESLEAARLNRPELQSLGRLSDALEWAIRKEKSAWYPNIGIGASYLLRKSAVSNRLDETLNGWAVGLSGSWAIFDGRAIEGKVLQARTLFEKTRLQIEETQLQIDIEVRRAYSAWKEADELVAASVSVVDLAQEALRLAESRFSVGTATQLDILQAQVELTEASTNRIEALYAYNLALAQLEKAIAQ